MRLARKLNFLLILGIIMVMATYAYVQVRHEVVLYEADRVRTRQLAFAWIGTLEAVWEQEGGRRAQQLVERANQRAAAVTLRLVGLDPAAGYLPKSDLTPDQLAALRGDKVVRFTRQDAAGDEWQHIYAALTTGSSHPAAVELVEPLKGEQTFIEMTHTAMLWATIAVITVCALIVTVVDFWFVGRPVRLLRDKARRAGSGDFSGPLALHQHDEIGDLAGELNAMCDHLAEARRRLDAETEARIAALEQMRHTDRLATVGQLAAGVAHELGTPLNVVSTRAQLIALADMPRQELTATANIIVEQSDRMTAIVQQLLDFSRRRTPKIEVVDLRHVITRTLELLSPVIEKADVTVDCDTGNRPVLAHVDANQMQQALANIVLNGIQAMTQRGALRVSAGARHARPPAGDSRPAGEYLCLTVEDSGAGIPPDRLSHIFEPFFTTKGVGEGTGLGLAVAHGIIAEHGGWIAVESTVGRGSRFSIFLPQLAVSPDLAVA
jgi:two-component system NtrC family sensor kinase